MTPPLEPAEDVDGSAAARRKRRTTIGLVVAVALAVAVHLGLGGAVLAAAPWAGWTAGGLVALVGVKVAVVAVLARLATRRGGSAGHRPVGLRSHFPRSRRSTTPVDTVTGVTATARVATPRADRYAKQLCGHARWKAQHAEWTPPTGEIRFPGDLGTCRLTATADHLLLVVTAVDAASLATVQRIIDANLERFAARDHLAVEWA
jgi:hypothetical protein